MISETSVSSPYRTGKVWVDFQLAYDLKGHDQSVLDVKVIEEDQFLTGTYISLPRVDY